MQIARVVARRSTCLRRNVGAVIVNEKRILATGYNGAPAGIGPLPGHRLPARELGIPSGPRYELCRAPTPSRT